MEECKVRRMGVWGRVKEQAKVGRMGVWGWLEQGKVGGMIVWGWLEQDKVGIMGCKVVWWIRLRLGEWGCG